MLNSLIATLVICLGLANNVKPVSNYENKNQKPQIAERKLQEKRATETNNYTLNISYANQVNHNNNPYYTIKYNLRNNNNYLNVIGNVYSQKHRQTISGTNYWNLANTNYMYSDSLLYLDGYETTSQYAKDMARLTYVFAITPYNYNVETKIRIRINIDINYTFADTGTTSLRSTIYSSTEYNWNNFIDQQLTDTTASDIIASIYNINNGYYYNYQVNDKVIQNSGSVDYLGYQEHEITIQPNIVNYYVIDYVPSMVEPQPVQEPYLYTSTSSPISVSTTNIRITGTNIIPNSDYEVIDLPGFMFQILTMPFAFISQAFNLTLFPGTPYQINISNLLLAIIAFLVFIFIIRIMMKMGSSIAMGG